MSDEFLDIMLDLETMSTKPNASIVAIGAVVMDFKTGKCHETFYNIVDLKTSVMTGGHLDPETIKWWLTQGELARSIFKDVGLTLKESLEAFGNFVSFQNTNRRVRVWGNGASFDCVILREAYSSLGLALPWRWWDDMCFRTVKNLNPSVLPPERTGTHHNALDDAIYQAQHLISIMKEMK